jgi:hypothetical protein
MQIFSRNISIPRPNIPYFKILVFNLSSFIGLCFFIIGTFFAFIFTSTLNKSSFYSFNNNVDTVNGKILKVNKTSFGFSSETGSHNDRIFEYIFSYTVDKSVFINKGYADGAKSNSNDIVNVKYKKDNHGVSKANGLRTSHYGLYILFVLVFPFLGIWLLIKGLKRGNTFIKSLQDGIQTEANFQSFEQKNEYYEHSYSFIDFNGVTRTVVENRNDKTIIQTVKVIYNRQEPDKSVVLNYKSLPLIFGKKTIKALINAT